MPVETDHLPIPSGNIVLLYLLSILLKFKQTAMLLRKTISIVALFAHFKLYIYGHDELFSRPKYI